MELREKVARVIDPFAWKIRDGDYGPEMQKKHEKKKNCLFSLGISDRLLEHFTITEKE